MNKIFRVWIIRGIAVMGILALFTLVGCKPETAQSPLATPEAANTQSRDGGRPRTVPPPGTPVTTPTPLPDRGVRAEVAQEVVTQADASSPLGTRFRLFGPATDGKTVVGTIRQDNKDVVAAIDLASGKAQILSDRQNYINEPRVSGRYVAWTTPHELYFYDLESGQSGQLDSGLATRHARISGDVIVWEKNTDSIWGHNFSSEKSFSIIERSKIIAESPEVSGQWVVYQAKTGTPPYAELRVVNIQTQEDIYLGEVFIGTQKSPYVPPLYAIDAPWVAWSSRGSQSPSPALYLHNLDTRTAYTVTVPSCPGSPGYLTMSNRVVIFSGCDQDMGYDIERKVFFSLPTNAPYGFDKLGWSIAGDQLVWVLSSGPYGQEDSHIYTARIIRDK